MDGNHGQTMTDVDMGYEDCAPQPRRGSMSLQEERERRASIQNIMADPKMSPLAKRRSIQHLMDGRRQSLTAAVGNNNNNNNNHCCIPQLPSLHDLNGNDQHMNGHYHQYSNSEQQNAAEMYGYGDTDTNASDRGGGAGRCTTTTTNTHPSLASTSMLGALCNEQTRNAVLNAPTCPHYDRKCTIISPCCGAPFGCRFCHDDCPTLPPKINNGGRRFHRSASLPSSFTFFETPEENHHPIDRFAIREVICRVCYTRQSSKTNHCAYCYIQFGKYHCNICNLWMDDAERPYHCSECGFCRVGGRENFRHCTSCGMCIDVKLYDNHNCNAGKYRSNCPVCQEFLFSSRGAAHEMPCGHAIHWDCFRQLAAHDSRCPVCKKTAETRERMMPTWNAMAAGVALQPVPPELARVVSISCNDCERSEDARAWHFLGMQCSHCSSFNTVVDRIHLQGEEAHEFLETQRRLNEVHQQQANNDQHHQRDLDPSTPTTPRRRFNRRRSAF